MIARAGMRTLLRASGPSSACCSLSWLPFFVRAVQIYAAANLPQAAFLAPTAGDVPAVPRPAGDLRLLRHRLRRRRPDRQRSPRQCAADLPVEAADAGRIRLRQAGDPDDVPAARHLAAGDRAARRADAVRRQLHLLQRTTCSCSRRSRCSRSSQVDHGRHGDAGAVVAVEEQPLRRRSSTRR